MHIVRGGLQQCWPMQRLAAVGQGRARRAAPLCVPKQACERANSHNTARGGAHVAAASPADSAAALQANEALRNHKRYMHYFERYNQHLDSLRKEKDNRCVPLWLGSRLRAALVSACAHACMSRVQCAAPCRTCVHAPSARPSNARHGWPLPRLCATRARRVKLLARIQSSVVEGTECRDFGWLVKALDQLSIARQVRARLRGQRRPRTVCTHAPGATGMPPAMAGQQHQPRPLPPLNTPCGHHTFFGCPGGPERAVWLPCCVGCAACAGAVQQLRVCLLLLRQLAVRG